MRDVTTPARDLGQGLDDTAILHRIYSGILGKAIGVRLGAPVEATIWTQDRIRDTYGEITGYLRDFKNFAADDDTNGPIYFIRVLRDHGADFTAADVGRLWLNLAAEEHGMFWWGGFGRSTEHTAYLNLKAGIEAPRSGSIAQNGHAIAEQIGGQIFVDSWGWVNPGVPGRAADMAARAASVSHDGEGLHGARFVAGAIAAAFIEPDIDTVIATALAQVPEASEYARVARAVLAHHRTQPDDWRSAQAMLVAEFGYDRYPGVCHIIPNAGVLIMALAYGRGDLCRTVEIATMAGWDTDCNAGNAGAIVGTLQTAGPGWARYRGPINDVLIASGVLGSCNIVDIPTFARQLAAQAARIAGRPVSAPDAEAETRRGLHLDFALPGSTHGFRSDGFHAVRLAHAAGQGPDGGGALEILVDRWERGQSARVFHKPFYRRADFDDERYRPMPVPLVTGGQRMSFALRMEPQAGDGYLRARPYVRRATSGRIEELGDGWQVPPADWTRVEVTLPPGEEAIDEIGVFLEYFGKLKFLGRVYLADFRVDGPGETTVIAAKEAEEWGAITRFTWNRGYWIKAGDRITGHTASDADLWTGHAEAGDAEVSADLERHSGGSHLLALRVRGTAQGYAAGFDGDDAVILARDFGETVLARVPLPLALRGPGPHEVTFSARGEALTLSIGGQVLATATDARFPRGQAGVRLGGPGRLSFSRLTIQETF
jgi:ADP-ribosylglycohydrolase